MFQLLNPIWLLAIGGIIIPLAIHLWSVKKGKTLKIGSIRLLGESSRQNARSLRLLDLLLLFLRCLMLTVLALLLAVPVFNQNIPTGKLKGWVLIDQEHLKETYSNFKPEIDSLLNRSYELHYLNHGFKKIDIEDLRNDHIEVRPDSMPELSYWSLVKALDKQLPSNTNSYIFTPNRLNRFVGERPKTNSKIIWKTYIPVDSVYNRIKSAYLTPADSLRLILAHSQPSGNTYTFENTSVTDLNPAYQLSQKNQPTIRFKNTGILKTGIDSSAIAIDISMMRIALFADKHPADLAYLKAGLEAVKTFSQRRISIKTYTDQAKIPAGLNWLFWLSELPLPQKGSKLAQHILSYQSGKVLTQSSSVILLDEGVSNKQNLGLYKTTSPAKTLQPDQSLWEDETGNPVLSLVNHKNFTEYKFYSRFNPEWNDLVWSAQFPELLLSLVFNGAEKISGFNSVDDSDRLAIDSSQINLVNSVKTPGTSAKAKTRQTDLKHFFWLLLLLLFAVERWASYKQKTRLGNG